MKKNIKKSVKDYTDIDVAVCYHKPSMIFSSDALIPMQLNKKLSKFDLHMRGDDTGKNISERNRFYSEDTALYWLWKNSKAKVKGCLHYRRLLDLTKAGEKSYSVIMEDIKDPKQFIENLGITKDTISALMKNTDILIKNKINLKEYFDGSVEEQFKAAHIHYHWDLAMKIVEEDYPEIYPFVKEISKGYVCYYNNQFIMKSELFDKLCEFCFHITEKLSSFIDETRLEFNDNWRYTARYLSFVWERMAGIFVIYLINQGYKFKEFPGVYIAPKDNPELEDIKNYDANAYNLDEQEYKIIPKFDKNAVPIMMATDDNYIPCCIAMIQSVIEHANPKRNYDIIVVTTGMTKFNKTLLENMTINNISIRVYDIKKYFEKFNNIEFNTRLHFSLDAYSRIFIPDLFEKYKKILYLDVDMIALRDVAELYDTDIGDNWWGVVQDKFFVTECHSTADTPMKKDLVDYIHNTLHMDCIAYMFNSGVMIWNIDRCKKDKVFEQCLAKLEEIKNPMFVDQCIMNSVANGKHIYWLSPYWNVAWNVSMHWLDGLNTESYNTALHYIENPYILHFSGPIKPWNEPWRDHAEVFWTYARKTPVYEKLLSKIYLSSQENNSIKEKYEKKIKKYKLLNAFTLGAIKFFRKKKQFYKKELEKYYISLQEKS